MMKTFKVIVVLWVAVLFAAECALAAEMYIYPNKGQSASQQAKDQAECGNWAKQQSAFDPAAPQKASAPPPAPGAPIGGVLRGGARGALGGLAIGAIAGNAGKGAAIGAAAGGLLGGMRRVDQVRSQQYAQQQWASQQAAIYEQNRANYNRAFGACMEGRGYTVK